MTSPRDLSISAQPTRVSAPTAISGKTRVMSRPGQGAIPVEEGAIHIREVQVGDLINNRFELVEELGSGGMGKVFKARDLRQVEAGDRDPWLALKTINPEFAGHDQAFAALQQEAKKTQKLAHPNIVSVYDFDRDGDLPFMTMELLKGESLDKTIKQNPQGLPLNKALELIKQICQAISYAHKFGVVHADLKPANLFLSTDGRVKVLDFGIAQALHFETSSFDAHSLQALTPTYASVSLLLGERPTKQDDLYAIGCIFYLLLRGVHPYDRRKATEAQADQMKPRRIRELSMAQWKALKSLLAFTPESQLSIELFEHRFFGLQRKNKTWMAMVSAGLLAGLLFLIFIYSWLKSETINELSQRLSSSSLSTIQSASVDYRNLDPDDQIVVLDQSRQTVLDNLEKELVALKSAKDYDILRRKLKLLLPLYTDSAKLKNLDRRFQNSFENYSNNLEYQLEQRFEKRDFFGGPPYFAQQIKNLVLLKKSSPVLQRYSAKAMLAKEVGLAMYLGKPDRAKQIAKQAIELYPKEKARFQAMLTKFDAKGSEQVAIEHSVGDSLVNLQQAANLWQKLKPENRAEFRDFMVQVKEINPELYYVINNSLHEYANSPHKGAKRVASYVEVTQPKASVRRVKPTDNCKLSYANLGKQANYRCRDTLKNGVQGPEMVVVLGTNAVPGFAVSRKEISVNEFNEFCRSSNTCKAAPKSSLPVTNVTVDQARAYTRWLSQNTAKQYRLPTTSQWFLYAKEDNGIQDHNCLIQKGGRTIRGNKLRPTAEGYPNSLGMVNVIGNAAEWVKGVSRYQAMGGSAVHLLQHCSRTVYSSNLESDEFVGFRVVRVLQ